MIHRHIALDPRNHSPAGRGKAAPRPRIGRTDRSIARDLAYRHRNGGFDARTSLARQGPAPAVTGGSALAGGSGHDGMIGSAGDDTLPGHDGSDHIAAGDGADELHRGDGSDRLLGRAGNDTPAIEGCSSEDLAEVRRLLHALNVRFDLQDHRLFHLDPAREYRLAVDGQQVLVSGVERLVFR
jgi:hypothetical protein